MEGAEMQEKATRLVGAVFGVAFTAMALSGAASSYDPSPRLVEMAQDYEGLRTEAYRDPAGVWTICYGHTGELAQPGAKLSPAVCEQILREELRDYKRAVAQAVAGVPTRPHELEAMALFAFNIGMGCAPETDCHSDGGFYASSVYRHHIAGRTRAAAAAFPLWHKATDPQTGELVSLRGLVRRREAERTIYLYGGT